MNVLIIAQTIFYFVISLAILFAGVTFGIIIFHIIHIAKSLREISLNISNASHDVKEKLEEVLEKFSFWSLASLFFKKRSKKGHVAKSHPDF